MAVCLSPNGPIVSVIDAAPTRLLIATIRGVAIAERADARSPWKLATRTLEASHVGSLARLPGTGAIFAGAHNGGLFFSGDGGVSWERRMQGLTIEHVFCLQTNVEGGKPILYAGTEPVSLFRSEDEGKSWREFPKIRDIPGAEKWTFPPPPHIAHTKSLTFVPGDPKTIYACIEQGALLKSEDGGLSWREQSSYYRSTDRTFRDIHRVIVMPSNHDELFMTSGVGVFHSLDAGETWEKLLDESFRIGYPDHLLLSPSDENVMYLSGSGSPPSAWHASHMAGGTVMKSVDRGRTWIAASHGLPTSGRPNVEATCGVAWPGGFTLFVGNTDGEVFSSEDGGETWSPVVSGLPPVSKVGHFRLVQPAA